MKLGTEETRREARVGLLEEGEVSLCSMSMGGRLFGIDTAKVREVLGRSDKGTRLGQQGGGSGARADLRKVPLAPAFIAGVIPYRGEVLTTLSLQALLGDGTERLGGCVLVLDFEGTSERLGLMVDEVGGVVTVKKSTLEENPCTLDARSRALFDGAYKLATGLIVRIDPQRLHPGRLAATGLFNAPVNAPVWGPASAPAGRPVDSLVSSPVSTPVSSPVDDFGDRW